MGMVLLAGALAGCGHAKEAEVVAAVEQKADIGMYFTADVTRLTNGTGSAEAGNKQLAAVFTADLAALGQVRPPVVAADHTDLVADLPAPGWAMRIRISPKPEFMTLVAIEPLATAPTEHTVTAAPWSVQDGLEFLRRQAPMLEPPGRRQPMDAARFARLRSEAAAAAAEERDPLLTPSEFVRVPRPITSEGGDRPYYTPPSEPSGLQKN
jgi:hypothetical protein